MKTKLALMLGLLLALLTPQGNDVESCSFPMYEDSRDVFFYFFDPGLALDARLRPLSFAGMPAATPAWDSAGDAKRDNVEAWSEHLKGRFTASEIDSIVYQAQLAGLQAVAVAGLAKAAPGAFQRFAASREDLDYLIFAKRCEPLVAPAANRDPWDSEDWHDLPAMAAMLEEGKKLRQKAKTPFIQDRYAFQVVRLAHYAGRHDEAVRLFDGFFPGPPRKGTIYYWSLALKAGALKRLEKPAESAYLFSLVFERCRSKRFEAYRGFRIDSDEAFRECLKLCRDVRERSVVQFLHGLDLNNSALEEMTAIHGELPDSPHLEVLLAREIARIERKLHGVAFNQRETYWDWPLRDPDEVFRGNLERLEAFLQKVVAEGRVKRVDFWNLALGYAQYLGGKLAAASEKLLAVRDEKATTLAVRQQAETFLWLTDIAGLQEVDNESEIRLFKEFRRIRDHFPRYDPGLFPAGYYTHQPWREEMEQEKGEMDELRNDPKFRFLRSALLGLYRKQKDDLKSFLASEMDSGGLEPPRWPQESLKRQGERLDCVIAFVEGSDRNPWEDFLLEVKYAMPAGIPAISRLLAEQKGVLLMRRCLWSEAVEALKNTAAPGTERPQLPDPFAEHPLHPWGGWAERTLAAEERLEFARAMAALTRKANVKAGPETYYRLGCALYNISYFGPCWNLLAFDRSTSGDHNPDTTTFLFREADRRFAQAESAAKDKEHAAKACFRRADIALKLYAVSAECSKAHQAIPYKRSDGTFIEYDQRQFAVLRAFANPHFPRLRQQYAATAYYQQVVKECKLFGYYSDRQ